MNRKLCVVSLLTAFLSAGALAQEKKPVKSPGGTPHQVHAITGATIVTRPGSRLLDATIVIRDGLVAAVGSKTVIPGDALVWDGSGLTIYPGLIEPYLRLDDLAPRKPDKKGPAKPKPAPKRGGALHANRKVRPERSVARTFQLGAETLGQLRKAGFTSALLAPSGGIFRGTSALVNLRDGTPRQQVVRAGVAQHLAFEFGGWGSRTYPHSLMGAMAVARQTLLDTEHYVFAHATYARAPRGRKRPEANLSLKALAPALGGDVPFCLEARDTQMLLRGVRLLGEFDVVPWVVLGKADAYRWLGELTQTTANVVLSLNFPPAPRWETPGERVGVELDTLRHWHLAPETPARLAKARVRFAFTTQGLKKRGDYRARVREAIARGLSPEAALAAFTTGPAALLRAPQLGVISKGGIANLTITDGDLFAEQTRVVEVWVDGIRYLQQTELPTREGLAGEWRLELLGGRTRLKLKHERGRLSGEARVEGSTAAWAKVEQLSLWRDRLTCVLPAAANRRALQLPLTLRVRGRLARGRWRLNANGGLVFGRQLAPAAPPKEKTKQPDPPAPPLQLAVTAPWPPLPEAAPATVLIKNATLWTLGPQGTLKGASMLVEDGRITRIGYRIPAPRGALVVDVAGQHVTPGIVDCHSHSFGTGSVNEATRNCTAEVRMADVIDAETVRIYQQLGGGVVAANLLHGSANAIGGQSAVVRLKWGQPARGLLFPGAPAGVKFALGENPKRSNWGQGLPPRYPTSRMGVLESIRERFHKARDYKRTLDAWRRSVKTGQAGAPPRIDLQLQALAEVLDGKRKVHCHSYRQDEILGLIRLAEQFGFTIGTFQHVLEGYKVADEIAAHGAGASTFSDWWAYKFEVYDAIAHNGALMLARGVVVSFNSDSSEMARRLNQEASKAVRYGGATEIEALKLVTLNPAIQLGISGATGSLEHGKQADFAVWSGHPLQTTSVCQQTWIQGRRYYERQRDARAYALAKAERTALLAAARAARYAKGALAPTDWQETFPPHPKRARRDAGRTSCCVGVGR